MTKIVIYSENNLSTRCVHESGAEIGTRHQKTDQGEGNLFSPTDLLATALGSCVLTLMQIMARKLGVDLPVLICTWKKKLVGKLGVLRR